jgi:hypothetical protein
MTEGVQYIQTGKAYFEDSNMREVVRIAITPQKHEIIYTPSYHPDLKHLNPEQRQFTELFDLLRNTARNAYHAVMEAGLTALNKGVPLPQDVLLRHFEIEAENLLVRIGEVEKDRDQWKQLAERRRIEVAVLQDTLKPDR